MDVQNFMSLFQFNPSLTLHIGVEREAFLTDLEHRIVPVAADVLHAAKDDLRFGYELSACQVETRVGPCVLSKVSEYLTQAEISLRGYLAQASDQIAENERAIQWFTGCNMWPRGSLIHTLYTEVGPADMPLDVYPDPSGRYQEIVKTMPRAVLLAACRVIGTHIHVGMPDATTALRVYNALVPKCDWLCARGNGSFGERLDIYRTVAPDCDPPVYRDWTDFYRVAVQKGFDKDPRKCWTLIRISKHGTIEFRMFGATDSIERIFGWATTCHELCAKAMG